MSKFQDFVIGMNEAAGITPAGAIILSQFGADEKNKALNSIKSQVRGAFQGIRSVVGKRESASDDGAQAVAYARRAARVRGTAENFLMMQTGLLRSVSKNISTMNDWMATPSAPATPTKATPTTARRTPMRDPITGRFVARELTAWERIAKSFESFRANMKPVANATPAPLQRDPKTGRFLPRETAPARNTWMNIADVLMKPLKGIRESLQEIQKKQIQPLLDKGIRLRDKGKDFAESMRKLMSPSEWSKRLQSVLTKPFQPFLTMFRRTGAPTEVKPEGTTTAAPDTPSTEETKKTSGLLSRMTNFMESVRDTFNDLPGVGAVTSLMVMKVTKAQTEELVKIREILERTFKLEQSAEARAERAEDAKEEESFEKRAGQARVMPTFDKLKKEKGGGGWFGGLMQTILGELVEGAMLRYGLGKIGNLFKKIPGVGKILSLLGRIGEFFEKIPGIGKLFRLFKGGGAAAGGVGILAKLGGIGEWLSGLTKVFSKIPGLGKLLGLGKGVLGKLAWPLTVIMGIFDFFSGWKDAGTILGKAEDQLTMMDRLGAGVGSVLGGLVGILDSVLGLFGIKTDLGGFVKKWYAKIYSTVANFLVDSIMKPFTALGEQIAKIFGFRSLQSAMDFAKFKLEKGTKFIKEAFTKMAATVSEYIDGLKKRAIEGIKSIGAAIGDFFTKTINWATEGVKNLASAIGEKFVGIGDSVAQYLGFDSMKSAYQALRDKITGVFSGIGAGVAKLLGFENFDALVDRVIALKDMILKPFTYIQEKIGGFVKGLGKIAGYLGYNDKEFADYEKKVNEDRANTARARQQKEQEAREAAQRASQSPNTPIQVPTAPASTPTAPPVAGQQYDPTLDTSRQADIPAPVRMPAAGAPPISSQAPTTEGQGAEWVRPLMSGVTSDFGMRKHPVTGQDAKMHEGTDYAGKMGDPVKAAGDGVVQLASSLRGYGNVVYLNHKNGYQTRYAHLSSFAPLSIGQEVKAGQVIGAVGNTGIGTGPHLHFEVRKGWSLANSQTKPENPEIFFRSQQETQEEDRSQRPQAVPVQRPPRDPDVMTGWKRPNPVASAISTGIGRMADTVLSKIPGGSTRPVVPPRDPSMRTPGPGAPGGGINYRPGQVPPEIAEMAVKMEKETGIPAAVTIAQWATESGWGQKSIGNNVFGITKARRHTKSQTKSTTEDITYDQLMKFNPEERASVRTLDGQPITGPWQGKMKVKMDRQFADFDTLEDAFRDHARLLSANTGPYKTAFDRYKMTGDVQGFIRDISPTYATDRNYSNVIGRIAGQRNVIDAIGSSRQALGVAPPPVTVAQAPTMGRDIMRTTAENAQMARALTQPSQGSTLNVAPVNVNQQTTSIVADLKARNTENTHKRIMDREYYRT
jgi:murein DD-endopeptidase MepM/ murein hydrolase activator NlpD